MPETVLRNDEPEEQEADPLPSRSSAGFFVWLIAVVLIVLCGTATLYRAHERGLNHDEHQFLAPAILYAREGLVPYRDYPIFHMPNLVYAYAAMAKMADDPVSGAKLLNVLATTGILGLLFFVALERTGNALGRWERLWLAAGTGALLLFDPLFLFTSGTTWNHELPAFLLAVATVFHVESFARERRWALTVLSGLAAGLAAGARLTYAPPCALFVLHLAWAGGVTWRERLRATLGWVLGCFIGLLPVWYFLVAHREAFLFDNFRVPRLSLIDPENTRAQKTITLPRKIRYFVKEVAPRSWPLLLVFIGIAVVPLMQAMRARRWGGGAIFMILLLGAVLAGCFAPSRYQHQHFYAVPVVAAIGVVYLCKEAVLEQRHRLLILSSLTLGAIISGVGYLPTREAKERPNGWRAYWDVRSMRDPALRFAPQYRQQLGVLQRYVPGGERILTLAPTAALVANRRIYPELATGVFGWRNARYVPPELRKRYHFIGPDDLAMVLHYVPPAAVLTGVEDPEHEAPLVAWAEANGYQKVELPKSRTLWVPDETYHLHRNFIRLEAEKKKQKRKALEKQGGGEKAPQDAESAPQ